MDKGPNNTPNPLNLDNVGGVFLVLVVGVIIACFLTFIELIWEVFRTSRKEKVSFRSELIAELKFVSKCRGSTKPVRRYKNEDEEEEESAKSEHGNKDFIPIGFESNKFSFKEPLS
uniref:Uncharacterized protein n=1 Tax=Timema monikensis TaxID=170555 RepID=A0A7R9EED1_9NEOP|nr:unnamed protein product [Timema monikensis]